MDSILTSHVHDDESGLSPRAGERRRERERRQHGGDDSRGSTWREIGTIVALVSLGFTVGYNWRELSTLHADYDRHVTRSDEDHKLYKLRGESDVEYREIQRQLSEIKAALAEAARKR